MEIRDQGARNKIDVAEGIGGVLEVRGDDNVVVVRRPISSITPHFSVGSGNRIDIGAQCVLGHLFIYAGDGATVSIGDEVGFNGQVRLLLHEAKTLTIGAHSLFGGDTDVSVSDMHSIFDVTTGKRINPARDVRIGERVWVGQRCLLLKGVSIGEGAIVGAGSVVTGRIPSRCLAAGNPASVLRTNVSWTRELLPEAPDGTS